MAVHMKDNDLMSRLTEIENKGFAALQQLVLVRRSVEHVGEFFDSRSDNAAGDDEMISDADRVAIIAGFNKAAQDHDITGDVLLTAMKLERELYNEICWLRNELSNGNVIQDVTCTYTITEVEE